MTVARKLANIDMACCRRCAAAHAGGREMSTFIFAVGRGRAGARHRGGRRSAVDDDDDG